MNIDWANGGSTIAGPGSGYVTSPVWDEDLILYGDLDAALIKAVKMVFDTLGHYSRYDVATLAVREDHWVPSVCLKDVAPRGLARFSHQEMKRISEEVEVDVETVEKIVFELEKASTAS